MYEGEAGTKVPPRPAACNPPGRGGVRRWNRTVSMPDTIFDQIVRGDAPAHRVWEDGDFLAFLDTRPSRPGHVLLVPKEVPERGGDDLFALPPDQYAALWERVRRLAEPIRTAMGARRVGVVVEGFGVAHVHVHLIPLDREGDLGPQAEEPVSHGELAAVAARIREAVEAAGV